jgi:hypothetical protein
MLIMLEAFRTWWRAKMGHDGNTGVVHRDRTGGDRPRRVALTDRPMTDPDLDVPTLEDVARTSAWSAFGDATANAHAATGSDRLRRYAEACQRAANAYYVARQYGAGDP